MLRGDYMRKRYLWGILLLLLFVPVSVYAGTRTVEGSTTGRYYNEVWGIWSEKPISVYVDEKGNTYIEGGEGLLYARGILYPGERHKFIELLRKGIKWAETARKEQLEITKNLGSFMKERSYGDKYGIKLTFFSANKGNQTDVILDIVDFDNIFNTITLYLNPSQVKELIELLEKVPQTLKELKEHEQKSKTLLK